MEKKEIRDFGREVDEVLDGRVDKIVLFGSYARGEQLPGSDIDLMIVLNEEIGGDRSRVSKIAGRYFLEKNVFISPKIITKHSLEEKSDFGFFQKIEQEGIKVYG